MQQVEQEVLNLVTNSYHQAKTILSDHLDQLHTLANLLLEVETVDLSKVQEIFGKPTVSEAAVV
jgi:cell division protease FtsH